MNDPAKTPIDIADQQKWLAAHREEHGLSWNDIATKTGIKYGTISQFCSGAYNGDMQKLADAVFRYRQLLVSQSAAEVDLPDLPPFFETPTTKRIKSTLSLAHRGRTVAIVGEPGTSKSEACKDYKDQFSNVWLATMKPSSAGINTMQQRVLKAMGRPNAKGTPLALTEQIEAVLRNSRGLLILDECQHLGGPALEEIRGWADETETGIALCGNREFLRMLTHGAKVDQFARLASRIKYRLILKGVTEGDALAFADAWGVEGQAERAFLVDKSKRAGGLRTCTQIMEIAVMLARIEGDPLSLPHLRDAWTDIALTGQAE